MPGWSVAAILALGTGHVLARYLPAPRLAGVLKPLPVALLAALVAATPLPIPLHYRAAIVAGLCCSMAGDVFLLSRTRFVPGLASFLVAHLLYITAFVPGGRWDATTWLLLAPLLAAAATMLTVLWPHVPRLRAPVTVYVLAIAVMVWRAGARAAGLGGASGALALAGALVFMASDSVLAVNRFVRPFHSAEAWVMTTYYTAQTLIAASALVPVEA